MVPDMLGYGGTDKPIDASEYSMKKLCADLAAILDLLQVSQAVSFVFHLVDPTGVQSVFL